MPPARRAAPSPPASAIAERRAKAARRATGSGYGDRRTAILAAAATLFKEHGYNRTTLGDIATAVGADRASLYYYFGSKEEVLDALVTHLVIANTEAAEKIRDSEGTAPQKLRQLIVDLLVSFAANYPMLYVYLQSNLSQTTGKRAAWAQQMREVNHRWEGAIEAIVAQGIDEGTLRPLADPRILANGVMGVVGWTHRWYNPAHDVDPTTIGEAYAEMILGGVEIPRKRPAQPRRPSSLRP